MTVPQRFNRDEIVSAERPLHAETRAVRFQDVDAAGTVFYPRFFEYFSDAYIAMLGKIGFDLAGQLATGGWNSPIVHAEADYLAPLVYGDVAVVEIARARPGRTSFALGYRVRKQDGTIAAIGQVVYVAIDRTTRAPIPLPEDLRLKLSQPSS